MDRKAASEFLNFIPFAFIAVVIIGGGIFLGVGSFYGKPYDMRNLEAQLLAEHMVSCFRDHDFFAPGFDVYSMCNLVASSLQNHLLFIQDSAGREWFVGIYDFTTQCGLSEKNDAYPRCVNGTVTKGGVVYTYIVGSNQHSKRL